jgi:hypothetical protein
MTVKDAGTGIDAAGSALRPVTIDGGVHWQSSSRVRASAPRRTLYLLPNYDEYLIAYKDRGSIRDRTQPASAPSLWVGFPHFLVIDGKLRGAWKRAVRAGRAVIELRLLRPLSTDERRRLDMEAARLARFAGLPVTVNGRQAGDYSPVA